MEAVFNSRKAADRTQAQIDAIPLATPRTPGGGPLAKDIYQNVQVLTDLDIGEFTRLMTAITNWVSPEQGCAYCHADDGDNASDVKYQKIVSRRMIEMTRHINGDWQPHVLQTGVTCFTCHRGNPVPEGTWFAAENVHRGVVGNRAGQNAPSPQVGLTSMLGDPMADFIKGAESIRVVSRDAIKTSSGLGASLQDTERTYGFMIYMSESTGVNCTGCHNTRSFFAWDQSRPQRLSAWHGIQMARDINTNYLVPITDLFPADRLGPSGDVAKVGCATCHQGVAKPLNGISMLADYPELLPPVTPPPAAEETVPAAEEAGLQTRTGPQGAPVRGANQEGDA
jgi:photosynthetic reaction center cytochrome c subunit